MYTPTYVLQIALTDVIPNPYTIILLLVLSGTCIIIRQTVDNNYCRRRVPGTPA